MINQRHAILHTIDTTGPGGAETVFLDLAEHLNVEGFDNIAVIKGPGWVEDQLKKRGIPYTIVKPHGFLSLPYYWKLLQLVRRQNVKLIQAHLLGSTLTYSLVSLVLGIPLIATIHGQVDINPNEKWVWLKNRLMRLGVNRLVAVSEQLADYIVKRRLFAKDKITVIYNGVQVDRYRQAPRDPAWLAQFGLPRDATLVGCLGNVRPAKAYHQLIEAAQLLGEEFPNLKFVIAGHQKPALMGQLEQQIARLGLEDSVRFIGFYPDTAKFLSQMDLFALSSTSEGFSIATIEAMASGLAVVATRCGGPEEIIEHQKTGLLVAKDSPAELAQGIRSLLTDPDLRARLGNQGKLQVAKRFSAAASRKEYSDIYHHYLS